MTTIEKVAPYAKAFIAALVAFLTAIATAVDSGGISAAEWITAVVALLIGFGAVFSIPNKPPFVPEAEPTTLSPPAKSTSAKNKKSAANE